MSQKQKKPLWKPSRVRLPDGSYGYRVSRANPERHTIESFRQVVERGEPVVFSTLTSASRLAKHFNRSEWNEELVREVAEINRFPGESDASTVARALLTVTTVRDHIFKKKG